MTRFLSAAYHLSQVIYVCRVEVGEDIQGLLAQHDISEQDFCKQGIPECLRSFEYVTNVQPSTKRNLIVRFEKVVRDARIHDVTRSFTIAETDTRAQVAAVHRRYEFGPGPFKAAEVFNLMQASTGIFRIINTNHELFLPMYYIGSDHVAMEKFYRLMLSGQMIAGSAS